MVLPSIKQAIANLRTRASSVIPSDRPQLSLVRSCAARAEAHSPPLPITSVLSLLAVNYSRYPTYSFQSVKRCNKDYDRDDYDAPKPAPLRSPLLRGPAYIALPNMQSVVLSPSRIFTCLSVSSTAPRRTRLGLAESWPMSAGLRRVTTSA